MATTTDHTRLQQALQRLQAAVGSVEGALVAPPPHDAAQVIDHRQGNLGFQVNGSDSLNAGGEARGEWDASGELKAIEDLLNQAIALLAEADDTPDRPETRLH